MDKVVLRVQFSRGDSHMNVIKNDLDTREYAYFYARDEMSSEVKKGDYAVVQVGSIIKIVRVVAVGTFPARATKHAIAVFSMDEHKKRIDREEKIGELKAAISERALEAKQRADFEQLAKSDAVLGNLMKQLQDLENQD